MNNISKAITIASAATFLLPIASLAALNLEGQSGVFLNTLAYPLARGKTEISTHYVNLDSLGSVSTYNATTGLQNGLELGFTRMTASVAGVENQSLLHAKWQAVQETDSTPAASISLINRQLSNQGSSVDYGLSLTKIVPGNHPVVLNLGVRSTRALGLGLFGFGDKRKLKFEGTAVIFVTDRFAVGTEFKQQIGAPTWRDIAVRYAVSEDLNIDAGIADLGPGLGNQVGLAATWSL